MLDTPARTEPPPVAGNWVARLQRFIAAPVEQCELCGQIVSEAHDHLLDLERREPVCTCLGCAMIVGSRIDGRYRAVPPVAERLDDFVMTDAEWRALQIPIGMAFLFRSTSENRIVALYPGPAGVTESPISTDAWATIVTNNPVVAAMAPDVEALLVNRVKQKRLTYRVSIDRCFVLVALFRKHWRGFTGGDPVWNAVDDFFADLDDPATARRGWSHG
jgi:hypothetical protein